MTRLVWFCLLAALAACTWRDPVFVVLDANVSDASSDLDEDAFHSCLGRPKIDAGTNPRAGLIVWYRCESVSGTTLPDSSGRGNHGTLASASRATTGPVIAAGKFGNGLNMVFENKGYVQMPPGLLADACEATIAIWVYINNIENAWTRLWDFGHDTQRYMFFTPINNIDNLARFSISVTGNQTEDGMKGTGALPALVWTHVAVVLGPMGGTLYVDGEIMSVNSELTLRPADLGATPNNYIGRSQFDDPYLDATIDEFRVYNRALSANEVRALLTAH